MTCENDAIQKQYALAVERGGARDKRAPPSGLRTLGLTRNNGYADINIGAYEKGQTVGPTPGAHTIVDEDTDLQKFCEQH